MLDVGVALEVLLIWWGVEGLVFKVEPLDIALVIDESARLLVGICER